MLASPALAETEAPAPLKPAIDSPSSKPRKRDKTAQPQDTDTIDDPAEKAIPATATLNALAESSGVEGEAALLSGCPLRHYKGKPLEFIEVKIKNNSGQPIIVLGNRVLARLGGDSGAPTAPETEEKLEKNSQSTLTRRQKFAVAAVAVSSLGIAAPIFHEMLKPEDNRKRNLGIALGRDGPRHEIEGERFTRRMIMPGDETSGWFGFDCSQGQITSVSVPVMFAPFDLPSGVLKVTVKPARTVGSDSSTPALKN